MSIIRLKENHPHMQKLNKLLGLADDLNIKIAFMGVRTICQIEDSFYELVDSESLGKNCEDIISELPPCCECALIYER